VALGAYLPEAEGNQEVKVGSRRFGGGPDSCMGTEKNLSIPAEEISVIVPLASEKRNTTNGGTQVSNKDKRLEIWGGAGRRKKTLTAGKKEGKGERGHNKFGRGVVNKDVSSSKLRRGVD